jgi:uncharacterized OB-fold protein
MQEQHADAVLTAGEPAWAGPVPVPDLDSEGYWAALRRHELAIQRCEDCRTWIHPPLAACPRCHSFTLGFEQVSGRGEVYSFTAVNREFSPGIRPPYVVALVDLDDADVRLVTDLVDVDSAAVRIGLPVEVTFRDITADATLAMFTSRSDEVPRG